MFLFPDQLLTTFLEFGGEDQVFEVTVDAETRKTVIRCLAGAGNGYEAILHFNGRLLVGFQEQWGDYNERLDFVWENGVASATSSLGMLHELHCDGAFRPIIWCIRGRNRFGDAVVLRYLRNFYDQYHVLHKSIRYEEGQDACTQIYQYFQYGIDDQRWKARKAFIYKNIYAIGSQEYWETQLPVDLIEFPRQFQALATEVLQRSGH